MRWQTAEAQAANALVLGDASMNAIYTQINQQLFDDDKEQLEEIQKFTLSNLVNNATVQNVKPKQKNQPAHILEQFIASDSQQRVPTPRLETATNIAEAYQQQNTEYRRRAVDLQGKLSKLRQLTRALNTKVDQKLIKANINTLPTNQAGIRQMSVDALLEIYEFYSLYQDKMSDSQRLKYRDIILQYESVKNRLIEAERLGRTPTEQEQRLGIDQRERGYSI